jgi:anti-anti-sigma factor
MNAGGVSICRGISTNPWTQKRLKENTGATNNTGNIGNDRAGGRSSGPRPSAYQRTEKKMIKHSDDGEKLTCYFEGSMDTDQCLKLEEEIEITVRGAKQSVVFNLEKVDYVASAFLRICIKIAKDIGVQKFSLTGVCPQVKKVFKIAGFDRFMTIQ